MNEIWPTFMPGYRVMGSVATFDSSSVRWPSNPASTKPAVVWIRRPSRPSDALALDAGDEVVGHADALRGRSEDEFARVEDECLVLVHRDQFGEVGQVLLHVDHGAGVTPEHEELSSSRTSIELGCTIAGRTGRS